MSMAHIHELIDFTIEVFIVYKDKVLLIHHKALDRWLPVGGHIELDEDPEQALFREIEEETGLTDIKVLGSKLDLERDGFKSLFAPVYLDIHRINETHRHIGMVYFVVSDKEQVRLEKDEHKDIRWFGKKDLVDPKYDLLPDVIFYARKALGIDR